MRTRTSQKYVFLLILLAFLLSTADLCFAQSKQPPPGSEERFANPQGTPDQGNPPDKEGKFSNPIVTERKQSQLMSPNEIYPPPEVRRFLVFLGITGLFFLYWFFLRKPVGNLIPKLGTMAGGISMDSLAKIPVPETSNHMLIEKMVLKMEEEEKVKIHSFKAFSNRSAFRNPPDTAKYGIDSWDNGVHLFITDEPGASRTLTLNIIKDVAGKEQPVVFISSRISNPELASGIIGLESNKSWTEMDETEKYRITRLVEDYMEKYNNIHAYPGLAIDEDRLGRIILKIKKEGKPSAVVIDELSMLADGPLERIYDFLSLISRREGFPVYVIDKKNMYHENESRRFRADTVREICKTGENSIRIKSMTGDNRPSIDFTINEKTGRLVLLN